MNDELTPPEAEKLNALKEAEKGIERIAQDLHCHHIKISHLPIPPLALDLLGAARHTLRVYRYLLEEEIVKRSDRYR